MTISKKPKIAFFDFTGCEGCQLTVIDTLQTNPQLLDIVEVVQFREAMREKGQDYDIAFIEGSYTRMADESRLKTIREQAKIVVTLGSCAHLGGVNAARNRRSSKEVHRIVYGPASKAQASHNALPILAIIPVEYIIPGCPIDRREFAQVLKALVQRQMPSLPEYPICMECKLQENVCLVKRGIPCLGPVTRAGCGAICPTFGTGCEGCRGLVSEPNLAWLQSASKKFGVTEPQAETAERLFLTNTLMEQEGKNYGQH